MLEALDDCLIGGCLPDEPGQSFPTLEKTGAIERPAKVDLRSYCSPVEDQRKVGSCVANAVVGALEYHQVRRGERVRDLSRLFVYYNARKLADKEIHDTGSSRRKALASVLGWGVCPEAMWPYQHAMVNEPPTKDCYTAAERFRGVEFAELEHGDAVKDALASGLPVVFGMAVPRLLMGIEGRKGRMRPPAGGRWEDARSGHAMLIVGYDDRENAFLVRNSWGTDWGEEGHVWIDYDVMMHYTQPPVYPGEKPFVIGAIAEHRAYQLSGPNADQVLQSVAQSAAPSLAAELQASRQSVASELEEHLSRSRQSIRDRLRGPGAGGGY
ncbi:MAG: C1 family peptidase [Henriciella sp.]|uniref:C1 family peptidase n=1 Tax=Henriciella sp. TaxID=1968823 RepID=UPI0032F0960C